MKELEIDVDEEPLFEPTDEGDILYFVKCPHCGMEHTIKVFGDCDEFNIWDIWCDCLKHFIIEYLPGVPNEKLLIY